MTLRTLIKDESVPYGNLAFKLTVKESFGPFRWTRIYWGDPPAWRTNSQKPIRNWRKIADLNTLLTRAQIGNTVTGIEPHGWTGVVPYWYV